MSPALIFLPQHTGDASISWISPPACRGRGLLLDFSPSLPGTGPSLGFLPQLAGDGAFSWISPPACWGSTGEAGEGVGSPDASLSARAASPDGVADEARADERRRHPRHRQGPLGLAGEDHDGPSPLPCD